MAHSSEEPMSQSSPATPVGSSPDASAGSSPDGSAESSQSAALRPRRPLRRRIALLVLVVGAAGLFAYWSRQRPSDVTVVYDFGRLAPRVERVSISFARHGEEMQPVEASFPTDRGAPRRYRHRLSLRPGRYTVIGRVSLRAHLDHKAEVRRYHRTVKVEAGRDQRLVLRLGR